MEAKNVHKDAVGSHEMDLSTNNCLVPEKEAEVPSKECSSICGPMPINT